MKRDYGIAEITIAWAIKEGSIHHLFARVDLLPEEFPPEPDSPMESHSVGDGWSIGHQKVYRSVEESLRFYQALTEGRLLDIANDGQPVKNAVVAEACKDTTFSIFTIASIGEQGGAPPYVADWQNCPRYHEFLARNPREVAFVSDDKRVAKAAEWFAYRISIDLMQYCEYWGGAALVAANPLFKTIDVRLWPDPEDTSKESVLVRLHRRRGKSLSGLKVTCSEIESGVSVETTFADDWVKLDFGHQLGKVTTVVRCPERGVLYATDPLHFLRSIGVTMNIVNQKIHIHVEDEVRNKMRDIEAQSVTKIDTFMGKKNEPDTQDNEKWRRQRQNKAKKYDQVWFDAMKFSQDEQQKQEIERAREYIRSRLNRARYNAWIVDPYFGALDFLTFFGAVQNWSLPIKILTSAEFLRFKRGKTREQEGDSLLKVKEDMDGKLAEGGLTCPLYEIRVMAGAKAPIHDRFIIADNDVWAIGSSLNEFGSRGSLALRLPNPDPIIEAIERVWNDLHTLHFEKWMVRRELP